MSNKRHNLESSRTRCNGLCAQEFKRTWNNTDNDNVIKSDAPKDVFYDIESKPKSIKSLQDPDKFKQILEEVGTSIQELYKTFNKAYKKSGHNVGDMTNYEQLKCVTCGRSITDATIGSKHGDFKTNFQGQPTQSNKSQQSKSKCIYVEPVTLAIPLTFHINSDSKEKTVRTDIIVEVFGEPTIIDKKKSKKTKIHSLPYEMDEEEPIRTATIAAYGAADRNLTRDANDCQCLMDEYGQYLEQKQVHDKSTLISEKAKPAASAVSVGNDTYYSCDSYEDEEPKIMFRSIASYTKEDYDKIFSEFDNKWQYPSKMLRSPMIAKTVQTESQVTGGRSKSLPIMPSEDKMSQTNPRDLGSGGVVQSNVSRSLDGLPLNITSAINKKSTETLRGKDDSSVKGKQITIIDDATSQPLNLALQQKASGVQEQPIVTATESYHTVVIPEAGEDVKETDKRTEQELPARADEKVVALPSAELVKQSNVKLPAQSQQAETDNKLVDKLTDKPPVGLLTQSLQSEVDESTEKSSTGLPTRIKDEQIDKTTVKPAFGVPTESSQPQMEKPIEKPSTDLIAQSSQPQTEGQQIDKRIEKPSADVLTQPQAQPETEGKEIDKPTEKPSAEVDESIEKPSAEVLTQPEKKPEATSEAQPKAEGKQADEPLKQPTAEIMAQSSQPQAEDHQVGKPTEGPTDVLLSETEEESKQIDKPIDKPITETEAPAPIVKKAIESISEATMRDVERKTEGGTQTDVTLDRGHQKRKSLRNDILGNLRCLIDENYAADHSAYTEEDKRIVENDLRKILIKHYTPIDNEKSITDDIKYIFAHMSESRQINVPNDVLPQTAQRDTLDTIRFILDPKSDVSPKIHFTKKDQEKMLEILTQLLQPPGTFGDELTEEERKNLVEEFRQKLYGRDITTDTEELIENEL